MKTFLRLRAVVLAGALLAALCGCTVQKKGEGANKKVDIETPVGSIHVNTQVDPKDTGLAVYPGATRAEEDDSKHAANLSIDSSLFGAKVVAIKYHSDDPPDKLLDFYRKQLKAYGEVTECHGSVSFVRGHMFCENTGSRDETNLVTGTEERRHIVSVKPDGGGSKFALVYVQTRGERGTL
ncbi:MAG TPA: hypothetical protein VES66_05105 [Terriglobales bacterium]|nr:hypothetical protein [Terriglobales bacterium]